MDVQVRDGDRLEGICGEVIGRYTLHARIAAGGMASVYLGSLTGAAEFSRVVAIKRMHPQFASDPTFAQRFRDEAWLSARLLHPNVVQTFDVVEWGTELLLVMEYIDGVTFKTLCADASAVGSALPPSVAAGILVPALHGLHAAHTATDDDGRSLRIVHRDFSPQNIIVGRDGHAKILDFGIARARSHLHVSVVGQLSGKYGYLAPEQIMGCEVDQRTDVFAAGIVLWEALTGERLFREPGLSEAATITRVLNKAVVPPSQFNPALSPSVDGIVLRALQRDPSRRFATARELALELEAALALASPSSIGSYMSEVSSARLERLSRTLARARRRSAVAARARVEPTRAAGTHEDTHVTAISGEPLFDAVPEPRSRHVRSGLLFGGALCVLALLLGVIGFMQREHFRAPGMGVSKESIRAIQQASLAVPSLAVPGAVSRSHDATAPTVAEARAPDQKPDANPIPQREPVVSRATAKPAHSPLRANAKPHSGKSKSVAPSDTACDPPTYLDSEGIRHFKAGCL